MKEFNKLSTEEKAKLYDEVVERLKDFRFEYRFSAFGDVIEEKFPEIAKSEDERIMKEILSFLKEGKPYHCPNSIKRQEWAAWIEKQCGQKEINLVEILKHYPKETELYSPLYGKLWLAEVDEKNEIITCYKHPLDEGCTRAVLEQEDTVSFYSNGTTGLPDFNVSKDCMLFLYDIEKQGENVYNDELSKLLHEVICHFINNPNIPYSKREEVSRKIIPYIEKLENQDDQKQDAIMQINLNPSEYINDMGGNGCYLKNTTQVSAWSEEFAKEMFIKALERVEEQNNKGYKLTDCDKNSWWEDFKAYISCAIEQKSADKVIEEEKPLLEKFKQAVYDCAWGKVTCKKEGETKEEYANRWAEHFLLMVRDWADDYIDFTVQQKLRNSYEKGKTDIIEKQDEQELAGSPKFKVGDWIVCCDYEPEQIIGIRTNSYYEMSNGDSRPFYMIDNNHNIRLWTLADAKDGDVLSDGKKIVIFKHFENPLYRQHIVAYIGLDISGNIQITDGTWKLGVDKAQPATKEQRDTLFAKMKEAGYEWDTEKKLTKQV